MQLTEQLYWYPWQGRANNCNSVVLKGEKTILFDPGHIKNELNENCLEKLKEQMAEDGLDITGVDLILCTHGHPDHIEAAGFIRDKSGAKIGIHKEDEFMVEMIIRYFSMQSADNLPSLNPDFYLEEGTLDTGAKSEEEQVKVLHTPGHSPGGVCFHLPGQQALVSGDTIFVGSIGRADLPGGSMETLAQSVEKLSRLEDIELLLPGHMSFISGASRVKQNTEQIKSFFFR
ncbi:MAG: MBL fold metallo-hydrolase [Bacillota bacterium]